MAQIATTILLDRTLNDQLISLCNRLGVSINTLLNQLVKNAVNANGISDALTKKSDSPYVKLEKLFWDMRADISDEPELTLDEINAEIAATRASRV